MPTVTPIRSFSSLLSLMKESGERCVAVVCPYDEATREAVCRAAAEGIARVVLVGEEARIGRPDGRLACSGRLTLVPAATPGEAARAAVRMVRRGGADVGMKGLLNTDVLLHAILDKEAGLLPPGRVLTHIMAAELPGSGRLLFGSDVAVIPHPTLDQRRAILSYGTAVCRAFGVVRPRVALLHYSEKTDERVPLTLDCRELVRRAGAGEWGDAIVDGPLDLRCALDAESERIKGIESPLEGRADFLLFPDLEAGNLFYKTLPLLCGARVAGMLAGAQCPVVLSSRSDQAGDKFLSLAFALYAASHGVAVSSPTDS